MSIVREQHLNNNQYYDLLKTLNYSLHVSGQVSFEMNQLILYNLRWIQPAMYMYLYVNLIQFNSIQHVLHNIVIVIAIQLQKRIMNFLKRWMQNNTNTTIISVVLNT